MTPRQDAQVQFSCLFKNDRRGGIGIYTLPIIQNTMLVVVEDKYK